MKLSEETKRLITEEYESFKAEQYKGLTKADQKKLGAFFTPAAISIKMIERFDNLDGNILDPTCGSGNLLAACLIAGADPKSIFGNEYDTKMVKLCRSRLNRVCDLLKKPHIVNWQIHKGDATDSFCLTEFGLDYPEKLRKHYGASGGGQQFSLFTDFNLFNLTTGQEEFLKEVD